jgi:hypothetical protein
LTRPSGVIPEHWPTRITTTGPPPPGPEAQKQGARAFRAVFPDAHFALELLVSADDLVAARWRCTATHGETGTRIADYVGVNFFRIADDKVVEIWDTRDDLGLFAQLGLVPPATEMLTQVYGPLAY